MIPVVLNKLSHDGLLRIVVLNLMNYFLGIGKAFSIETFSSDDSVNVRSSTEPTFEVFFFFCLNMKKLLVLSLMDSLQFWSFTVFRQDERLRQQTVQLLRSVIGRWKCHHHSNSQNKKIVAKAINYIDCHHKKNVALYFESNEKSHDFYSYRY